MKPPRPRPSAMQHRMTRSTISAIWLGIAEVWYTSCAKEAVTLTVMKESCWSAGLSVQKNLFSSTRLKRNPQEARCDQLTSDAAVHNGHQNFRLIISFWYVDSPSVVICCGSAGIHRSSSTHAPRTNWITLVSCIPFEHTGWSWDHA